MSYKNKEGRKKHYEKNKDKINAKRRLYNNKPEVKKLLCIQRKRWRDNNLEERKKYEREYSKTYRDKMRRLVMEHYGKKCVCCGEDNIKFLSVDHINGGGAKHRIKIHGKINFWLIKNNYPRGFQILCFNCNWGRYNNGGICPHKEKSNSNEL